MILRNALICIALLTIAACSGQMSEIPNGHYWEVMDATKLPYKRGPEAQIALDRDISRCVVDLRELQDTTALRTSIPANESARGLNYDQQRGADWDTPEHDGALLAEHTDYPDFEICMKDKGWKRVTYVPYKVADEATANWYLANVKYGYDPRIGSAKGPAKQRDLSLND
jgi:hypothetical protein